MYSVLIYLVTPLFLVKCCCIKLYPGEHYTGAIESNEEEKTEPASKGRGAIHIRQRRVNKHQKGHFVRKKVVQIL